MMSVPSEMHCRLMPRMYVIAKMVAITSWTVIAMTRPDLQQIYMNETNKCYHQRLYRLPYKLSDLVYYYFRLVWRYC